MSLCRDLLVVSTASRRSRRWRWDACRHRICISGEDPATVTAALAITLKDGINEGAVTVKRRTLLFYPSIVVGISAAILLAPQAAFALDIRFVLQGVMGVFRELKADQTTTLPPAQAELMVMSSNNAALGLYSLAPLCQLPDCGFLSVDASGRNLTATSRFHGFNDEGWQLLITPSGTGPSSGENWALQGSLFHCPGFERDGDLGACPEPTPDTEPRTGPLTPMPHGDPTEDAVPGPLPILGAAAAFRCSRRLRQRLRGGLSGSSQTAAAPPGPRPAAG